MKARSVTKAFIHFISAYLKHRSVSGICPYESQFIKNENISVSCILGVSSKQLDKGSQSYFHLLSNGIPNHSFNDSYVTPHRYDLVIPVEQEKRSRLLFKSKADLYNIRTLGTKPIGFALNGVPFHSALLQDNTDAVQSQQGQNHDDCMGYISSSGKYFYRTAPPCLFSAIEKKGQGMDHGVYDSFSFQNGFGFYYKGYKLYWTTKVDGAPFIIGYAIDGNPIYSPFDADGNEHKDLDECNGKFKNGQYAYYSKLHFPYILGCFGPIDPILKDDLKFAPNQNPRYSTNATEGTCKPCRAGRFGKYGTSCKGNHCIGDVNSDCTGPCSAGYFCPESSHSSKQQDCGTSNYYCPKGSASRRKVEKGFYSTPLKKDDDYGIDSNWDHQKNAQHKSGQALCNPGFWCRDGIRFPCSESGAYGEISGLTNENCSAPCPIGHYCLPFAPNPIKCPAGSYGQTLGLKSSSCSGLCDPGFYCEAGSISSKSKPCPAGRAGIEYGLKNEQCSLQCDMTGSNCILHECQKGYFCPQNSTSQTQFVCGGPQFYCPKGSSTPKKVKNGFYSIGKKSIEGIMQFNDDNDTRTGETECEKGHYCVNGIKFICPPGRYGDSQGLTSKKCSGECEPGYYCPQGSIKMNQIPCGRSQYYCPRSAQLPILADKGYYTYNSTSQYPCPAGSYCILGMRYLCPAGTYGSSVGLSDCKCDGPSSPGYYTTTGSTSSTQYPCPAGTYGLSGMSNENCAGRAAPGFYTPKASSSPKERECGGDMVYCPEGSAYPLNVSIGYFSVGGTATTRTNQQRCNSFQKKNSKGVTKFQTCPSNTRTQDTLIIYTNPPQMVYANYHIDPEDQFRYNFSYPPNF